MTLAYLAARRVDRFGAATFMVSLLDFSEVGDTAVFIDEPQIAYRGIWSCFSGGPSQPIMV